MKRANTFFVFLTLIPVLAYGVVQINPRDIKPGTVNVAEFETLDGLRTNIQWQIDNKEWSTNTAVTNVQMGAFDMIDVNSVIGSGSGIISGFLDIYVGNLSVTNIIVGTGAVTQAEINRWNQASTNAAFATNWISTNTILSDATNWVLNQYYVTNMVLSAITNFNISKSGRQLILQYPTNVGFFSNDAGYLTSESDPVWGSASNLYYLITIADQTFQSTSPVLTQVANSNAVSLTNILVGSIVGTVVTGVTEVSADSNYLAVSGNQIEFCVTNGVAGVSGDWWTNSPTTLVTVPTNTHPGAGSARIWKSDDGTNFYWATDSTGGAAEWWTNSPTSLVTVPTNTHPGPGNDRLMKSPDGTNFYWAQDAGGAGEQTPVTNNINYVGFDATNMRALYVTNANVESILLVGGTNVMSEIALCVTNGSMTGGGSFGVSLAGRTLQYTWGTNLSLFNDDVGYLTSESDPIWSAASNLYATTNWVTSQGYLTSESDPIWSSASNLYYLASVADQTFQPTSSVLTEVANSNGVSLTNLLVDSLIGTVITGIVEDAADSNYLAVVGNQIQFCITNETETGFQTPITNDIDYAGFLATNMSDLYVTNLYISGLLEVGGTNVMSEIALSVTNASMAGGVSFDVTLAGRVLQHTWGTNLSLFNDDVGYLMSDGSIAWTGDSNLDGNNTTNGGSADYTNLYVTSIHHPSSGGLTTVSNAPSDHGGGLTIESGDTDSGGSSGGPLELFGGDAADAYGDPPGGTGGIIRLVSGSGGDSDSDDGGDGGDIIVTTGDGGDSVADTPGNAGNFILSSGTPGDGGIYGYASIAMHYLSLLNGSNGSEHVRFDLDSGTVYGYTNLWKDFYVDSSVTGSPSFNLSNASELTDAAITNSNLNKLRVNDGDGLTGLVQYVEWALYPTNAPYNHILGGLRDEVRTLEKITVKTDASTATVCIVELYATNYVGVGDTTNVTMIGTRSGDVSNSFFDASVSTNCYVYPKVVNWDPTCSNIWITIKMRTGSAP